MDGEISLRPAKFDELCDKLAEKYGENPESVWRETVGDEAADGDAGEVDWYQTSCNTPARPCCGRLLTLWLRVMQGHFVRRRIWRERVVTQR